MSELGGMSKRGWDIRAGEGCQSKGWMSELGGMS